MTDAGVVPGPPLSEPVRRLLEALATYQVTRPGFCDRIGRMGTLH